MAWSPDGRHFALAGRRAGRWQVVRDFAEGPEWDGVASLAFSPDGRELVYAALEAGRWRVVRNGVAGRAFDALVEGSVGWSPDGRRFGYAAVEGACARVVIGEELHPCHTSVRSVTLADSADQDTFVVVDRATPMVLHGSQSYAMPGLLSYAADARCGRWATVLEANGAHVVVEQGAEVDRAFEVANLALAPDGRLVYTARREDGWRFVLEGRAEGPYPEIHTPVFSRDGARHGYVASTADGATVVVDGVRQGAWRAAEGIVFSPDGDRVAWAARRGEAALIVCDGRAYEFDVVVETAIAFSSSGAHWAGLVGDRRRRELSIVVDGERHIPFDSAELFGAQAQDAADPGRLREWVLAELERELDGAGR